ncbi:MAG: glycine--tRNA ligase subunit beta [Enhydrobacter sp.]|nr:MAG: glycine--tRNA ligase subunit beta [Enhydrobacter sp.]
MAELLLELLSEEIPARMQARAAEDLKRLIADGLKIIGLPFTDMRSFATSRRLALVVDGLPTVRPDVTEEKRGPRVGAPDQAIQGFLRAVGLASLDQAEKRDTGKGEFWFATVKKNGGPTAEALPGVIEFARLLSWPKSMKWGSGTAQWVRPVQSIVAVFDGKVLDGDFPIGGDMAPVKFGDTTRGHRFLSNGEIRVSSFADYQAKLRDAHVLIDATERKKIIIEGAERLCRSAQVGLKNDAALLDEVAGLVEWPVPLMGTIDAAFMDVPPEVLIVSMKTHQRYFSTEKKDGQLANRFVVVANNVAADGGRTIVDGNERVLRARLSDAKFFWDQDRKVRLEDRLLALKDVVFHAKLGSQADRVGRIARLAVEIAGLVPGAERGHVEQAALLCKADLVSGMVGEFPELQGVMGRYYALSEELPMEVAEAIGDHYAPAGPNDRCPSAPVSIAVALADKLDALVSFWAIGEQPTGSRDPFALRRAALGCIRLITETGIRVPLSQLLKTHYEHIAYRDPSVADRLIDYFNRDGRDMQEERRLISLINASTFRSYLAEGLVLDNVIKLFERTDESSMSIFDASPHVDILVDRAEDIQRMSGSSNVGNRTPRMLAQRALFTNTDAEEDLDAYKARIDAHSAKCLDSLLSFIADRLKVQMREKGVRHDIVDAVFALGGEDDLVRLLARVGAVQSFVETDAGKNLLTAYARAANIVRAEEKKDKTLLARIAGVADAALLEQAEEKAVASSLADVGRSARAALEREDFAGAMAALAGLRAPIDAFFEKVTVNVTDKPELRLNRLKLLNQIRATMDAVADFSRIEG